MTKALDALQAAEDALMTTPREDAIAAGPDAREAFIRRIVALTPGNFTDDFLFLLDRLDEARAAMTTPREDAIAALREAAEVTVGVGSSTLPHHWRASMFAALNDLRDALDALAAAPETPRRLDGAYDVWLDDAPRRERPA